MHRFYYQYRPERLTTCVLTVHALLHLADSIEAVGPVWTYWAFPMERFCGTVQRHIKSRRFPFSSIDRYLVSVTRLEHLGIRFNIRETLALKPNKGELPRGSFTHASCKYLCTPSLFGPIINYIFVF